MSRTRKALVATGFTYAQWLLTALSGLFLTRFLIRALGQDLYGTWLATGSLLGYAGLADLGILGVMPWLFAEAEGAGDTAKIRKLLSHGLAAGAAGGLLYLIVALCVWSLLPQLLHLSLSDRETLRGPVLAMSVVTAIGYPMRLLSSLRLGLQDYAFMGSVGIAQTLLGLAIVVALTEGGAGLFGVALGAAVPPLVTGALALGRTLYSNPELLAGWVRLRWSSLTPIVTSGSGQWLGSMGWQLASASDGAVIAYLGHRSLVTSFTVTAGLGLTLMRLSWALPDSSSVGLAQLNAEGRTERVTKVVGALVRVHLLAAGLIACGVLAGNLGFVSVWIGRDLYGGALLNCALAINLIALSLVHGLMVPVAVLGRRLTVGLLTLLNGVLHIGLALILGHAWGLSGVAAATFLSALLTTIPAGLKMLAAITSLSVREIALRIAGPWVRRLVPCCGVALLANWAPTLTVAKDVDPRGVTALSLLAGAVVGIMYLLIMRPLMRDLPLSPGIRRLFVALRLA